MTDPEEIHTGQNEKTGDAGTVHPPVLKQSSPILLGVCICIIIAGLVILIYGPELGLPVGTCGADTIPMTYASTVVPTYAESLLHEFGEAEPDPATVSAAARFGRASPRGLPEGAGPGTIPVETAYNNTVWTFWTFTIGGPYGADPNWTSAAVDPEPVVLYDVSGQPLYYEFYLTSNTMAPGYFWTAADRRLGAGVFRINEWPGPLNRTLQAVDAEEIVAGRYPGSRVRAERTVLYGGSFRSGTMVMLVNNTTGSAEKVIVEDYTREVIPITGITPAGGSGSAQSILAAIQENEAADRRRQGEIQDVNVSRMIGYIMTRGIDIRQPLSEESRDIIREYLESVP